MMHEKEYKVDVGPKTRTLHVDYLARVEGEGAFIVRTKDDKVEEVQLKIFEPPRFFEAFLQSRQFSEAPDITSRICGICPVAYQMSAIRAMEDALGVEIPEYIQQVRRLLYCGEWIESHTLHVYMLHAPDFLGFPDIVQMAAKYPEIVQKGLRLKKAGNEIIKTLGGREVHPINAKVGGWYSLPLKRELERLLPLLEIAQADAIETVRWVNSFTFPNLIKNYECISLSHPSEYPITQGMITSSSLGTIPPSEFQTHFEEVHVSHSTALQAKMKQKGSYLTGPIARYNLNSQKLSPIVQKISREIQFESICQNPFRSIIVRALEIVEACTEAIRLINLYDAEKLAPSVQLHGKAAVGYGATEAPRGLLYHKYTLDDTGAIKTATIIPPTSQNQKTIEEDLFEFVTNHMTLSDEELTYQCEQAIRNYDPCISCSTHFLRLNRIYE